MWLKIVEWTTTLSSAKCQPGDDFSVTTTDKKERDRLLGLGGKKKREEFQAEKGEEKNKGKPKGYLGP